MSKLSAFLNPAPIQEEKDVVVSKRFTDEDGNVVPFRIRSMSQEETEAITKKATILEKVNGVVQERIDSAAFARLMVVAATVEPNFSSTELCQRYGTLDPSLVPGKMLRAGEFNALLQEISQLSGVSGLEDEVKN